MFFSEDLPLDCSELSFKGEANSGIYVIKPNHSEPFNVYCEMTPGEHCKRFQDVVRGYQFDSNRKEDVYAT